MRIKADYLGAPWSDGIQARFWRKVDRAGDDSCWPWIGSVSPKGYGAFTIGRKRYAAHRLLIVKTAGDAFLGKVCDHLCRNRRCVNPRHLEVVTNSENIRRGIGPLLNKQRGQAQQCCAHGHPYTPETTRYNPRGSRTCRLCDREQRKQRRARLASLEVGNG